MPPATFCNARYLCQIVNTVICTGIIQAKTYVILNIITTTIFGVIVASSIKPKVYKRRQPETLALFKIVQHHFESWLSDYSLNHNEILPRYIEDEFRSYIKCGVLAHGFARARCPDCGHDFFIAFSCKKRGLCPFCVTKYMAMISAHLTDQVLPIVATRQFVLSLPKWLRYYVAKDSGLSSRVLKIFIQSIEKQFKKWVKLSNLKTPFLFRKVKLINFFI